MMYFLIVAHKALCHTLSEDMLDFLLILQAFLAEDPLRIEYVFCGTPSRIETSLVFCNDLFYW